MSCRRSEPGRGRVIVPVPLGMKDQSWNPDLAWDHIGSYRGPMICVMHDPLGAPRHRGSVPRCIGPKLPENSGLTTYRSCRTGREPGAPGRYDVRRASLVPSLQVPGTDLSDCAIGVPVLVRFRRDRMQSLRLENETAGKHACGKMMDLRKADPPTKQSPRVE